MNCRTGILRALALASLLAWALSLAAPSQAGSPLPHHDSPRPAGEDSSFNLTQLTGITDIVLRGVHPSYRFYLPVPEDWKLNQTALHLRYTHSPLLDDVSTLTVEVNDSPVDSLRLVPENVGPAVWDVTIPPDLLTGELLVVSLVAYLRVTDDVCADLDNAASWVRVFPASSIDFSYDPLALQPELARFPAPFISVRSLTPDAAVIVTPPEPAGQELAPALYLASALGARATWRGIQLFGLMPAELTDEFRSDYNFILVGRADRLTLIQDIGEKWPLGVRADGTIATPDGRPVDPDTGVIMLITSPWNPTRSVLAVTGRTDAAVAKAARAVRLAEFASLVRGSWALVPTEPVGGATAPAQVVDWSSASLEALGYDDQTVHGIGKHTLHYVIDLPNAAKAESMRLRITIGHSPFVTTDRSYAVAMLNGIPQAGLYLVKENEQQGVWEATIPGSQIDAGRNTLDIVFDLHLADYEACDDLYLDRAWAVVYKVTTLSMQFAGSNDKPDLSRFPVPFDTGSLVVVPQYPGAQERAGAFQLFTELGVRMGPRAQTLLIQSADQVNEGMLREQHVLLFGRPANNRWVASALQSAPVRFDGTARSLNTRLVDLSLTDGESVGLIEALPSPWSKDRLAVIITGADDKGVGWASTLLLNPAQRQRLKGDVAVVDSRGFVTTIDSHAPPKIDATVPPTRRPGFQWLQFAVVGLLAVAAVFLTVVILRRRRSG